MNRTLFVGPQLVPRTMSLNIYKYKPVQDGYSLVMRRFLAGHCRTD